MQAYLHAGMLHALRLAIGFVTAVSSSKHHGEFIEANKNGRDFLAIVYSGFTVRN